MSWEVPLAQACPFCAGTALRRRAIVRGYCYAECARCGVVTLYPFPSADQIASWYQDGSYFEQESGNSGYVDYVMLQEGFRRTFLRRNRFLGKDFWARKPSVLEIGCAYGFYPAALDDGVVYHGIDLNPRGAMMRGESFAEGVKRTGADVAKDNADCPHSQGNQLALVVTVPFGSVARLGLVLHLLTHRTATP